VLAADKAAVLFVDTFNGYFRDRERPCRGAGAAGRRLHGAHRHKGGGHLCCGRTYLATGMVGPGARQGGELVDALLPFAQAASPSWAWSPRCLLTLRDERWRWAWASGRRTVSTQALLFEEFLAREAQGGPLER
jgi:hypothetical protein